MAKLRDSRRFLGILPLYPSMIITFTELFKLTLISIADPCSISLQLINTNLVNLEFIIAQEQAGHKAAEEVWRYVVVGLVVH